MCEHLEGLHSLASQPFPNEVNMDVTKSCRGKSFIKWINKYFKISILMPNTVNINRCKLGKQKILGSSIYFKSIKISWGQKIYEPSC